MNYGDQIDRILKEPKEFFANFIPNTTFENESDLNEQAIKFRQGLSVMENTLNKLKDLNPSLADNDKHTIIKNSFNNVTEVFREIVALIDLDLKNMGSSKVNELIKQIQF